MNVSVRVEHGRADGIVFVEAFREYEPQRGDYLPVDGGYVEWYRFDVDDLPFAPEAVEP